MPKILHASSSNGNNIPAASARYGSLTGNIMGLLSADGSNFTVRDNVTLSRFFVYVSANTSNGVTTYSVLKNNLPGNETIAVGAGATGFFQDAVNMDSFVPGDLVQVTGANAGTVGAITHTMHGVLVSTVDNVIAYIGGVYNVDTLGASVYYFTVGGNMDYILSSVEADTQFTVRQATTYSFMTVVERLVNTINGNSVFNFRIDGVNGNQNVTIGALATGTFQDAVNSDIVPAGKKIDVLLTTGGLVAQSMRVQNIHLRSLSTAQAVVNSTTSAGSTFPAGATNFLYASGMTYLGTAVSVSPRAEVDTMVNNLYVNVGANTLTGAAVVQSIKNGAPGALVVTIGAGATGIFEDLVHDDTLHSTDTYCKSVDTSAAGAGTIRLLMITFAISDLNQSQSTILSDLVAAGMV